MLNVIVPITENPEKFSDFIKKHAGKNVKFYVGVTEGLAEKLPKISGAEVHVYKNGTKKEEILNALHKLGIKKGKILVVRRPLEDEEFEKLSNSKAEVSSLRTHHNKFVSFFKNLARKIIRRVFSFLYFEDISAVCFSENLFELMSVCPDLSMATRINRYVGVEVAEYESTQKPVKKEFSHLKAALWLGFSLLIALGSIAGGILIFVFIPHLWAVYVLLILTWWAIAIACGLFGCVRFIRAITIGDLNFDAGEEIVSKKGSKNEKN